MIKIDNLNPNQLVYSDSNKRLISGNQFTGDYTFIYNDLSASGDITTISDLNVSGDCLATGDFYIPNSAWNKGHIILGDYHIWVDGSGNLRMKGTAPLSADDGTIIGTQT